MRYFSVSIEWTHETDSDYIADHRSNEDVIQIDVTVHHISEASARTVVGEDEDVRGVHRSADEQIKIVVTKIFELKTQENG